MTGSHPSHVFLSYGEENEPFAAALALRLRDDAHLSFWFRPWHAVPGQDLQAQMEAALLNARCCAVLIGPGPIEGWHNAQMRAAIQSRVEDDPGYRVIPVLLPGVGRPRQRDLPPFLRLYEPVEFQAPGDERAFKTLLAGILGIPPIEVDGFLQSLEERPAPSPEPLPAPPGPLQIDPANPPFLAIRKLLLAAFEPDTLYRFLHDRPDLRPVAAGFGPGHSLEERVDQVLSYCDAHVLWDELLAAVAQEYPRQYARFEPQLRGQKRSG